MIKRITSIFMVVIIACTSVFAVSGLAAGIAYEGVRPASRVLDMDNLLSQSEADALLEKLDEISERQQFDVAVFTIKSSVTNVTNASPQVVAGDLYDTLGYGFGNNHDGVLLLVMTDPHGDKRHITTTGFGETAFTDAGLQWIVKQIKPLLEEGQYYEAFNNFADYCDDFVTEAKDGKPYDYGHMPKDPFKVGKNLIIALAIGVVLSFIVVTTMKSKLKTVHQKANASDYTRPGSMNLTASNDVFLYNHVDRTRRVKDDDRGGGSSTHTSSSGSSHGGISF